MSAHETYVDHMSSIVNLYHQSVFIALDLKNRTISLNNFNIAVLRFNFPRITPVFDASLAKLGKKILFGIGITLAEFLQFSFGYNTHTPNHIAPDSD